MTRGVKGTRSGRMKPCVVCGAEFWCLPSNDVGGTQRLRKHCSVKCMGETYRHTPEMFFAKTDKLENGCWVWRGYKDKWGYGHVGLNGRRKQAHRHAYELTYGKPPTGRLVMHICDNPPCINPQHLRLGTDADNNRDKVVKGRHPTKLTVEQVREIKAALATPYKGINKALAKQYGVSDAQICTIRQGRQWRHV